MDNKFNDTNYGMIAQNGGQLCPVCGGWEISLSLMRLAKVLPDEPFECEECGSLLSYSVIKNDPKQEQIILHSILDSTQTGLTKADFI